MAHHQHHGGHMEAPRLDKVTASQPTSTGMPSISEDELAGEADEPPERKPRASFMKTAPPPNIRRHSLLTKALHTDTESHSESHDESLGFSSFDRQASRSSTCSTWSARSDLTSDDGLASNMSSPGTKAVGGLAGMAFRQLDYGSKTTELKTLNTTSPDTSRVSPLQEPAYMSKDAGADAAAPGAAQDPASGRKRCITFACGRQNKPEEKVNMPVVAQTDTEGNVEIKKRPCMLKFACPSKISWKGLDKEQQATNVTKHSSPPPMQQRLKSPSPAATQGRPHRDSDTTIRNDSPKSVRKVAPTEARKTISEDPELDRSEASAFHEFASAEEHVEEWAQESTCHRSRLTVQDTLKKENDLRQIGEEAEEEAMEEEDEDDEATSEGMDSEDEEIGSGHETDDEEGFAESDDDSDDGSDYEWWALRRSSRVATMAPADGLRPPQARVNSDSSLSSMTSPKYRDAPKKKSKTKSRTKTEALPIRPATPELPDSTDFVCGTLDEDRPMEMAYASCLEQRKAAKHVARPQDIDPTFPTDLSGSDEEDELDEDPVVHDARDHHTDTDLMHGPLDDMHGEEAARGRKPPTIADAPRKSPPPKLTRRIKSPPPTVAGRRRSPAVAGAAKRLKSPPLATSKRLKSPPPPATSKRLKSSAPAASKRLKSPPPPAATSKRNKSPAPHVVAGAKATEIHDDPPRGRTLRSPPASRLLFGHSPRGIRTPPSGQRLSSPPPSRHGSPPRVKPMSIAFGTAFLGHRPQLTHTTSLPRSPNPLARRHGHVPLTPRDPAPLVSDPDSDDEAFSTPYGNVTMALPASASATISKPATVSSDSAEEDEDEDDDEGNDTAREAATPTATTYTRGAIDIVQGLERKRLRRRMKFHEKYYRKEERKHQQLRERGGSGEAKRPVPGRGAERMRQFGIECAMYRGKRVLSV